jgi:hypothetical protein
MCPLWVRRIGLDMLGSGHSLQNGIRERQHLGVLDDDLAVPDAREQHDMPSIMVNRSAYNLVEVLHTR